MKKPFNFLQEIYDSEINFRISTFWDAGFDWALGDEMNGYKSEGCEDTFDEACTALLEAVSAHYSESDAIKRYLIWASAS